MDSQLDSLALPECSRLTQFYTQIAITIRNYNIPTYYVNKKKLRTYLHAFIYFGVINAQIMNMKIRNGFRNAREPIFLQTYLKTQINDI